MLNSWLMTWRHHRRSPKAKKALFPKVLVSDLRDVPIPKLSANNATDCGRHEKVASLVEQMLAAKRQLSGAQSDKERDFYENKCAGLDRQIDALVYELYGLTAEEITIVEGSAR
jgi:hypothetical protein